MKRDDMQAAGNSQLAYQQMTQAEKEEHDALVKKLDSMLTERHSRDRRQHPVAIDFADRRIADRRILKR